jgi:hypothetical protein
LATSEQQPYLKGMKHKPKYLLRCPNVTRSREKPLGTHSSTTTDQSAFHHNQTLFAKPSECACNAKIKYNLKLSTRLYFGLPQISNWMPSLIPVCVRSSVYTHRAPVYRMCLRVWLSRRTRYYSGPLCRLMDREDTGYVPRAATWIWLGALACSEPHVQCHKTAQPASQR